MSKRGTERVELVLFVYTFFSDDFETQRGADHERERYENRNRHQGGRTADGVESVENEFRNEDQIDRERKRKRDQLRLCEVRLQQFSVGSNRLRFANRCCCCCWLRVKEAIKRKDETIRTLQSERDAALDQCSEMERLLERQRKQLLKLE